MYGAAGVLLVSLSLAVLSCANDTAGPPARSGAEPSAAACLATGAQDERDNIRLFFAAYNSGDLRGIQRVAKLNEIWDPVGAPQHKTLTPEVAEWLAGGQRARDRLSILEMCVYPGQGADGEVVRNSDVLRSAGMRDLVQGVKLRLGDGLLRQVVLYMPQGETKASFCGRFGAVLEEIEALERPETPQCA